MLLTSREKFLQSLQQIIQGVKQNMEKVEAKLSEETAKKDKLNGDYSAAVEKERLYYKMTKDFLLECAKNEKLIAQSEKWEEGDNESVTWFVKSNWNEWMHPCLVASSLPFFCYLFLESNN